MLSANVSFAFSNWCCVTASRFFQIGHSNFICLYSNRSIFVYAIYSPHRRVIWSFDVKIYFSVRSVNSVLDLVFYCCFAPLIFFHQWITILYSFNWLFRCTFTNKNYNTLCITDYCGFFSFLKSSIRLSVFDTFIESFILIFLSFRFYFYFWNVDIFFL